MLEELGEVMCVILLEAGEEDSVERVLDAGLGDTAGNIDPSEEGGEAIALEAVLADD